MKDIQPTGRPLILVTLFGGGWHQETFRILQQFPAEEFRFAYAYGHADGVHAAARLHMPQPGLRYPIHYVGSLLQRPSRFLRDVARHFLSFVDAFKLIHRLRPTAILALGTATALPLCVAGRLFGIPTLFVESLTRVEHMSLTGKILYHLRLTERQYVQWDGLQKKCQRTTYAGAVL